MQNKLDTSTDPQVGFRPSGTLDATTALQPYTGHFSTRQAAHLLRRAGFGGSAADVADLSARGMSGAVDSLLHPTAPDFSFPDYPTTDLLMGANFGQSKAATQMWWLDRMLRTRRPLVEKMTLFWHGHFASSIQKVPAPLMARQINLLRSQSLGNFRSLLAAVSIDPGMLIFLDNRANTKAHPNENYAREVMELFALGLGNYTEDDIKEIARALTGWQYDGRTQTSVFNPKLHDDGSKTFLGRTGNFGLDDVVSTIVMQPIHQRYITRKLLEFFVYSDPEPELIEATAQTYALSGFDIAKTVGTIIRSNVFYSSRAYRAVPKSPVEFAIGLLRYAGQPAVPTNLPDQLRRMGQEPLAPPSVKGWDGGPTWINTNTLLARFNFVNGFIATTAPKKPTTTAGVAANAAMLASVPAVAPAPNVQPDAIVALAGGLNPDRVIEAIVSTAVQDDVTSDVRRTLTDYLNSASTAPANEAANPMPFGHENYQEKIRGAIALTLNLPVNQLN